MLVLTPGQVRLLPLLLVYSFVALLLSPSPCDNRLHSTPNTAEPRLAALLTAEPRLAASLTTEPRLAAPLYLRRFAALQFISGPRITAVAATLAKPGLAARQGSQPPLEAAYVPMTARKNVFLNIVLSQLRRSFASCSIVYQARNPRLQP